MSSQGTSVPFTRVWHHLWNKMKPKRGLFLAGLFFSLSQASIMMLEPLFVNLFFNYLELQQFEKIKLLVGISLAAFLLLAAIGLIGEYWKKTSMASLNTDLMEEVADHAHRARYEHVSEMHSSDLVQRVTQDSPRVAGLLTVTLDQLLDQFVMLLLASVYLLWLNWKLAVLILVLSPVMLLISHSVRRNLSAIGTNIANQESAVRQCQHEALQNIEVVRSYGLSDWINERFIQERKKLNQLYMKKAWYYQVISLITTSFSNLLILVCVLTVGWMAIHESMALGSLLVFFTLVWRVTSPMQSIGSMWGQVLEILGVSPRIFDVLAMEKEPASPVSEEPLLVDGGMELRHIGLHYNREKDRSESPVGNHSVMGVEDVHIQVAPGSLVAIVGPSGSGKSTTAKIAAGLLMPSEGELLLGGLDSRVNAEVWRSQIAYIPQTSYLFSGTIRDNLQKVRPEASESELLEAVRMAQAEAFIRALPNGLDTKLQELGQSLSGGEIQRMAIARAILADRPILILDEATSALDYDTERALMRDLWTYVKTHDKMVIVIAHRLMTIKEADYIYVFQGGRVVAEGRHQDLLAEDKMYLQLWEQYTSA
ncbi:ABC transporter ATP-binding protein [Gorillibacterium sp. CAU 1737]|uniref:ABC transporter ATP-binding protein n=1 Tax=Gorillibacterium sp. CAU 1737 TaxID=3140362 RepID=UPI0032616DDF